MVYQIVLHEPGRFRVPPFSVALYMRLTAANFRPRTTGHTTHSL